MESYEITKQQNKNLELSSLDSKIDFNRNLFRKELENLSTRGINFNFKIDELIGKILSVEEGEAILDFIKYKDKSYSLYISKGEKNDNGNRLDIYNKEESFNTFRSENPNVAGWVGQAEFISEDDYSSYHSENHGGISVAEELKGSGFADLLYDLKCQVDNQLEFEHVTVDNLQLLSFYIKKGYVPYSFIKFNPVHEEIIDKNELDKIILEIKEWQKNRNQSKGRDSVKLKLDPEEAMIIYSKIKISI